MNRRELYEWFLIWDMYASRVDLLLVLVFGCAVGFLIGYSIAIWKGRRDHGTFKG